MSNLAALPVMVDAEASRRGEITRSVEALGWQVVGREDVLVPPRLRLVDVASADIDAGLPTVLVIDDAAAPRHAAAAAIACGAKATIAWPSERSRLEALATRVQQRTASGRTQVTTVGGSAGGVGTSTVVLALTGLTAWEGTAALAAVRGDAAVSEVPDLALADLTGAGLWTAAAPLPGVPDARAVRLVDPTTGEREIVDGPPVCILDRGVCTDVDVLVIRRDRAGLDAIAITTAGVVVVVDQGPIAMSQVRAAAGGRQLIELEHSSRVARATVRRRVPAGLPGRWLAPLRPLALAAAKGAGRR